MTADRQYDDKYIISKINEISKVTIYSRIEVVKLIKELADIATAARFSLDNVISNSREKEQHYQPTPELRYQQRTTKYGGMKQQKILQQKWSRTLIPKTQEDHGSLRSIKDIDSIWKDVPTISG